MRRIAAFLIKLAYLTGLRWWLNRIQQWRAGEDTARRSPLPRFLTPNQMVAFVRAKFSYRKDKEVGRFGAVDWSSPPEVFQARLESDSPDGDCDDYHAWCAEVLTRMPEVTDVVRVSCWTWIRGHTACLFRRGGSLYLIDYDLLEVSSYEDALSTIHDRHHWVGPLVGWVFETVDLEAVAIYPELP